MPVLYTLSKDFVESPCSLSAVVYPLSLTLFGYMHLAMDDATRNPRFLFTLFVAAPSTQSSWPAAYNGKWLERAIIDHMYNAALYSGGLRRWCCRPTFTSRPIDGPEQISGPPKGAKPPIRGQKVSHGYELYFEYNIPQSYYDLCISRNDSFRDL